MKKVLCLLLFLFCNCSEPYIQKESIEIDYTLPVGIKNNEIKIRYLGMPTPSTFAIDRFPGTSIAIPIYYPIGIDTIFDGDGKESKAYLVREVAPKYLKVHRFK